MKRTFLSLSLVSVLTACNNETAQTENDAPKKETVIKADTIPKTRTTINSAAAATYSEKVPDELNDWKFAVKLYETKNTFTYTVKIEYEELRETETINFPDFGMMPEPQIIKGKEPQSCIIGFLDKNKTFKEYILVQAKGDRLKMTTLQHYSVYKSETKL